MTLNKINKNMVEGLPQELSGLTAQLAQTNSQKADKTEINALATEKANKSEVNALASEKADKTDLLATDVIAKDAQAKAINPLGQIGDNAIPSSKLKQATDADKIKLDNLSQEVRDAIAGTTTIGNTPAPGSVTAKELANESVTSSKRTKLGEVARVMLGSTGGLPNINRATKELIFPSTFFIVSGKNRYTVTAPLTINYVVEGTNNPIIYFDTTTQQFVVRPQNNIGTLSESCILFATISHNSIGAIIGVDIGCRYTIDERDPYTYFLSSTPELVHTSGSYAIITLGATNITPDYNTSNHIFTFGGSFNIFWRNQRYLFSDGYSFDFSTVRVGHSALAVYFNTKNKSFSIKPQTQTTSAADDDVLIFVISYGGGTVSSIYISCEYTINGQTTAQRNLEKELNSRSYQFSVGKLSTKYPDSNLLGIADSGSPFNFNDDTHETIYQLYDEIMANNPNYITKTLLGYDTSTGQLPIYKYDFIPLRPSGSTSGYKPFPKITMGGTIHGGENAGVYSLYYFFKRLCNDWMSDDTLEYLRHNLIYSVIPVQSPWEFNNKSYTNINGVNINRNFDFDWQDSADTTKGSTPFSENESKIIRDFLIANNPFFHIDVHARGAGEKLPEDKLMWITNSITETHYISLNTIESVSRRWKKKYNMTNVEHHGYSTLSNAPGTCKAYAWNVLKIRAVTWEAFSRSENIGTLSKQVMDMNADWLGEFLVNVVKTYQDK